jgi:hypothetical protein
MSKTVLGILNDENESREVILELSAAGFSDADIEVVSDADSINVGDISGPKSTTVSGREKNKSGKTIADFFRSIYGPIDQNEQNEGQTPTYAEDQSYYVEALERGRVVLIIRAPDQQSADYACKVLNRYGGDNISTDTAPQVRGVTTIQPSNARSQDAETSASHLTPSERTEGRVENRGVRVYDYGNASEGPADLREPQPDPASGRRSSAAKP